jgi:hypothetical protein
MNILAASQFSTKNETRYQSGFQKSVGKTERTVKRHAAGIQYVNIIGFLDSPYYSHAPIL